MKSDDPVQTYSNLRSRFDLPCLLESARGADKLTELSILVFDPSYIFRASKGNVEIVNRLDSTGVSSFFQEDPLSTLQEVMAAFPSSSTDLRFLGGALGYISYDSVRYWNNLEKNEKQASKFPDMEFGLYEEGIVFDNKQGRAYYFFSDGVKDRSSEVEQVCNKAPEAPANLSFTKPTSNKKKEEFESSVIKAKEYIRSGEIFQVVLSKRYSFNISGDLLRFYSELRQLNPSPYMYYLDLGDTKIAGSSPEMLVRVDRGEVETFPIAGTRPSSQDEAENQRLGEQLLADPKERAEHIMLVDLARNDIGKIAEFGSVNLGEFMQVHRYSHVQHIVSQVKGKLKGDLTSFDALRSLFPSGTVSGAPKIRAMQIIDEIERDARGPYAGALGYFTFNGNMDVAITIRTLVSRNNEASIQSGAGIVADSVPETEWFETERKSEALMRALENTGGKN
ncbi:MAG: anthranilate synthase component I family protein [Nitrososphaerales archaeon]